MSEARVSVPEYSVAALQIANDFAEARAVVDPQTALAWAYANNVELPKAGRLAAINAARMAAGLPCFHVKIQAPAAAAPVAPILKPVPQVESANTLTQAPPSPVDPNKIVRTSAGLRDVLFAEMEALRAGTSTPKQAMAIAKLASTIVESVKMEMEFVRLNPSQTDLPKPLHLVQS